MLQPDNITLETINKASHTDFVQFIHDVVNHPLKYFSRWIGYAKYQDYHFGQLHISECRCTDGSHDRFKSGNTRINVENKIIEQVKNLPRNQKINLLSLGAGMYLQDLMILFRLVVLGFTNIDFTFIEPKGPYQAGSHLNENSDALKDFKCLLEKIKNLPGMTLNYSFHKSVEEVTQTTSSSSSSASKQYDVVYAIDYDEIEAGDDFSERRRNLHKRNGFHYHLDTETKTERGFNLGTMGLFDLDQVKELLNDDAVKKKPYKNKRYLTNIDLIKACSLLKSNEHAFCAVSHHREIEILVPHATYPVVYSNNDPKIHPIKSPNLFNKYIINANIGLLLANLSLLIKEKKQVIINQNLILPEDKPYLDTLLNKFKIPYTYYSNDNEIKQITNSDDLVCVLDGIAFDTSRNEIAKAPPFDQNNFAVVRFDYIKGRNDKKNALECFPNSIQIQIDYLKKNNLLNYLFTNPCSINRIKSCFLPETMTLSNYLIELSLSSSEGMTKAQNIIYHLANNDITSAEAEIILNRNSYGAFLGTVGLGNTGAQIWKELIEKFPDTLSSNSRYTTSQLQTGRVV